MESRIIEGLRYGRLCTEDRSCCECRCDSEAERRDKHPRSKYAMFECAGHAASLRLLEADAKWNEITAAAPRPQKQRDLGIPGLQLIQGFISRSAAMSHDGES